jgi:small subunit ribosomal protein S17
MANTTNTTTQSKDAQSNPRGKRKTVIGTVLSDKMDKTITVVVERRVKHPLYEKFVRRRSRLHAHDEANEARTGDRVEVAETRRLSKLKRWRLVRILSRAAR